MTHSGHSPTDPTAFEDDAEDVEVLEGGNVSDQVLRIGATVRKPWLRSSPAVTALLRHLRLHGYPAAPITYGERPKGYQRLSYVPGTLADRMPPMNADELRELGAMIRRLHDLTADHRPAADARWESVFPPEEPEVICHNDLAPWNLVRDPGSGPDSWCFIDWDGAGPGSRMGDLGYAAHGFVPLHEGGDPGADGLRLRALADGYGCDADQRRELPEAALRRVRGMFELLEEGARTGRQPWARLHAEGHADHWGPAAAYVARHRERWTEALTAR
ncbi:phosphotransferase enzyme family protein [Nocardiopsis ganjiahuensis]|uniref:phosphotransferase enzyme family protein n=1 Tax=Nocardiopsis ganjiahuensis TaxID=239984 RepID=UPI00034B90F5|nr:phosphotransferase [Nocardiopsis ganjiahuensis]